MQLRHRRHRSAIALTAGLLAVVTGVSTTASFAAGQHQPRAGAEQHSDPGADARGGFDARRGTGDKARAALLRDAARAASRPETRRLRGSLGDQALLDLDGATGTPRLLTRLDGFLTGRSSQSAAQVTLGYVADHHDALGLSSRDLKTLPPAPRLRRRRRHPPPVLDAEDRRGRRLRQRPAVRGHRRRPAGQPRRLAGLRGVRRLHRRHPARHRRPGHLRGPHGAGRHRLPGRPRHRPPGAVRDPLGHPPRLEHGHDVGRAPDPDGPRRAHRRAAVPPPAVVRRHRHGREGRPEERQRRAGLPVLPARAARRQPGVGRLHGQGLARRQRHQALRQQLPRLLRRERRRRGAGHRGGRAVGRAPLGLRAQAVLGAGRVLLRQPLPVLVEPERAVLLAGQPRAERRAGVLLRQQLARPPARRADRLHRGGRQLPAAQQHPRRRRR